MSSLAHELEAERRQRLRILHHRWRTSAAKGKARRLSLLAKALAGLPQLEIAVALGADAAREVSDAIEARK